MADVDGDLHSTLADFGAAVVDVVAVSVAKLVAVADGVACSFFHLSETVVAARQSGQHQSFLVVELTENLVVAQIVVVADTKPVRTVHHSRVIVI